MNESVASITPIPAPGEPESAQGDRRPVIVFDLGGVVVLFSHERMLQQISRASSVGVERCRQVIFDGDLQLRYERGEIDDREFHRLFCQLTDSNVDFAQLKLAASSIFDLNVSILPLLGRLRYCGYSLALLSNTCPAHWEYVSDGRYTAIGSIFDRVVLSYEVGSVKPEPKIFQIAESKLGRTGQDLIFFDDRDENVRAAADAGWAAHTYTTARQAAADLDTRGVVTNC